MSSPKSSCWSSKRNRMSVRLGLRWHVMIRNSQWKQIVHWQTSRWISWSMLLPGCCFLNGTKKSREIMANNKISAFYHTLFQSREGQRDEAWLWQILNWIWNTSRYMPGRWTPLPQKQRIQGDLRGWAANVYDAVLFSDRVFSCIWSSWAKYEKVHEQLPWPFANTGQGTNDRRPQSARCLEMITLPRNVPNLAMDCFWSAWTFMSDTRYNIWSQRRKQAICQKSGLLMRTYICLQSYCLSILIYRMNLAHWQAKLFLLPIIHHQGKGRNISLICLMKFRKNWLQKKGMRSSISFSTPLTGWRISRFNSSDPLWIRYG